MTDSTGYGQSRREWIGQERRRQQRQSYLFPTYGRVRDPERRWHPGAWIASLAILTLLAGIGYWVYNYQFATETSVTMTVNRLDDQASGSTHTYLIFATDASGQPEVFKDTDAIFHWKWNSSDVFAGLKAGGKYTCDVFGRRNHLTSNYRNVLSCTPVPAGSGS